MIRIKRIKTKNEDGIRVTKRHESTEVITTINDKIFLIELIFLYICS